MARSLRGVPILLGFSLFCALLAGCAGDWVLEVPERRRDIPQFPRTPALDYDPREVFAHSACPPFDPERKAFASDRGRVWVKGSARYASGFVTCGEERSSFRLDPPFYTATLEVAPGDARVCFEGDDGREVVPVKVVDPASLARRSVPFSLLCYGGFQPFDARDGRALLLRSEPLDPPSSRAPIDTLCALRLAFASVARGDLPDLAPPVMILGNGDQIYAESAYHTYLDDPVGHPLSAWTVETDPRPRVSPSGFVTHADLAYRAHWSFETLDGALRTLPSVMTWDDHEIRDGWGSHGDEHVYRETYFAAARRAFLAHQFTRGPRGDADLDSEAPLHQAFELRGLPVFVLDTRSHRDVRVPRVLDDAQWSALRAWFHELDPEVSRHYLIVSSIPLFFRVADRGKILIDLFEEEIRDDLLDAWTSVPNEGEWKALLRLMIQAHERGLRALVVSGDLHRGCVLRAWIEPRAGGPKEILANELVTSGLATADAAGWKMRVAREGWIDEEEVPIGEWNLTTEIAYAPPGANFGALEFGASWIDANLFRADSAAVDRWRLPLTWQPEKVEETELYEDFEGARSEIDRGFLEREIDRWWRESSAVSSHDTAPR